MKMVSLKSKTYHLSPNSGQVIILTVLVLGGTILGATTVAGLLMLYQIRQAGDMGHSGRAIFAADSGIEWALYTSLNPEEKLMPPEFKNGATVDVKCFDNDGESTECLGANAQEVRSVGSSGNTSRAFGLVF